MSQSQYEHTLADAIRVLMDFGSKNKTTLDTSPATDDAILWMQENSEQVAVFILQALATPPAATEPQEAEVRYVVEVYRTTPKTKKPKTWVVRDTEENFILHFSERETIDFADQSEAQKYANDYNAYHEASRLNARARGGAE